MFRVLVVAAVVALSSAFSLRPAFAALANSTAASRHSHKASTRLGRLGGKLSTIASCGGANDHAKNLVLSVTP